MNVQLDFARWLYCTLYSSTANIQISTGHKVPATWSSITFCLVSASVIIDVSDALSFDVIPVTEELVFNPISSYPALLKIDVCFA
jgi:hypothetical protein